MNTLYVHDTIQMKQTEQDIMNTLMFMIYESSVGICKLANSCYYQFDPAGKGTNTYEAAAFTWICQTSD